MAVDPHPTLAQRVEAAEGPDRELDALILCALAAPAGSFVEQSRFNDEWCIYSGRSASGAARLWDRRGSWYRPEGWDVTASLDAALVLVTSKLPDANTIGFEQNPHGCDAYVGRNYVREGHWQVEASARTPALALLAALLRALESEHG